MIKFSATNALVHSVTPVIEIESRSGGQPFCKRELIIDDSWDKDGKHYANFVSIEFTGDKMAQLDSVYPGMRVNVDGLLSGREYNNRIITMTGRRTLITSRILNLNSPGVEMESETFEWEHIDEFDLAVQNLIYEVKEYIVNRKWEVVQATLFDGDPDDPFAGAEPTNDAPPVEQPAENVA